MIEKIWAIIPKAQPLKCVCVCVYELQGAQKKNNTTLYIDIHISLKVTLGCGPTSNPKSTNTHGTQ